MEEMLPSLMLFLYDTCLVDEQPLVRAITCWTLSRYARWIVEVGPEHEESFFQPLVANVIACNTSTILTHVV